MNISARLSAVQSPVIPIIADLIRRHPGTLSLAQGVVNYGPPPEVATQLQSFLLQPELNKYQSALGLPPLCAAIETKLTRDNNIEVGSERIVMVTAGSNMAFMHAILAIADPGDEVILLTPHYFNHEMALTMANIKPVSVATDEHFLPDIEAILAAITSRTRAVVTISPNNPTGAVYPEDTLTCISQLCAQHALYHIHDEAYEYFTYEGARHFSPAALSTSVDHTISLFSLSKSHGLASWRIGYLLAPRALLPALLKIQDTALICAPVISQWVAVAALNQGWDYPRRQLPAIADSRNLVLDALASAQDCVQFSAQKGAFYCFLLLNSRLSDMAIAERLITEFGVALLPGSTFGAPSTLRLSYGALPTAHVESAMERLLVGLRAIGGSTNKPPT